VVKVFTFNPAGNTTQESFARVTNWGNTGGKVTVEGWDDAGAAATGGDVTFNPAGNTTQESFLRVSNWGNTGGKVTVEGWDDAGAAGASDITFTLPAGESLQFNSGDVENGNATKFTSGAFGDGAGKWRLVVTGEFDGMNVISLNRNNTVGTLTNLTDSDNGGEQKSDSK